MHCNVFWKTFKYAVAITSTKRRSMSSNMTNVTLHLQFLTIIRRKNVSNVLLRYIVSQYHAAFVYVIDGMAILTLFFYYRN